MKTVAARKRSVGGQLPGQGASLLHRHHRPFVHGRIRRAFSGTVVGILWRHTLAHRLNNGRFRVPLRKSSVLVIDTAFAGSPPALSERLEAIAASQIVEEESAVEHRRRWWGRRTPGRMLFSIIDLVTPDGSNNEILHRLQRVLSQPTRAIDSNQLSLCRFLCVFPRFFDGFFRAVECGRSTRSRGFG